MDNQGGKTHGRPYEHVFYLTIKDAHTLKKMHRWLNTVNLPIIKFIAWLYQKRIKGCMISAN
jgi:hypothetical protein